jgi:ADP-ribosyl-[dinitrogen reductase] hydrolase
MLTPGWHRDTYLEEYHRGFFARHARGTPLRSCGIRDGHIGGLAQVPALVAALPGTSAGDLRAIVQEHVGLTHRHGKVLRAADCLVRLLVGLREGGALREVMRREAGDWFSTRRAGKWALRPDLEVVGAVLSPACYIEQAFPAALYLAWRHHERFVDGVVANAMAGGDNCHRGVVVGALLGASRGVPDELVSGLRAAGDCPAGEPSS